MTNEEKKIILINLKTTLYMCDVSRESKNEANRLLNRLFDDDSKCDEKVKIKK